MLGRLFIEDKRDLDYPIAPLLKSVAKKERSYKYHWAQGYWGDQGGLPHCVAFAWLHYLEDGPVTQNHVPAPCIDTLEFYNRCQKVDYWIGEDYDGTSVRAGAKIAKEMGYIESYRFTTKVEELVETVINIGPVILGTNWYLDMTRPNVDGTVTPTGEDHGGHAYIVNGANWNTRMARIKNSWGRGWGKNGYCYISFDDLQILLDQNGECCLPIEIKKAA